MRILSLDFKWDFVEIVFMISKFAKLTAYVKCRFYDHFVCVGNSLLLLLGDLETSNSEFKRIIFSFGLGHRAKIGQ